MAKRKHKKKDNKKKSHEDSSSDNSGSDHTICDITAAKRYVKRLMQIEPDIKKDIVLLFFRIDQNETVKLETNKYKSNSTHVKKYLHKLLDSLGLRKSKKGFSRTTFTPALLQTMEDAFVLPKSTSTSQQNTTQSDIPANVVITTGPQLPTAADIEAYTQSQSIANISTGDDDFGPIRPDQLTTHDKAQLELLKLQRESKNNKKTSQEQKREEWLTVIPGKEKAPQGVSSVVSRTFKTSGHNTKQDLEGWGQIQGRNLKRKTDDARKMEIQSAEIEDMRRLSNITTKHVQKEKKTISETEMKEQLYQEFLEERKAKKARKKANKQQQQEEEFSFDHDVLFAIGYRNKNLNGSSYQQQNEASMLASNFSASGHLQQKL